MTTKIRKANPGDAESIRKLVNSYASENRMLPRSLSEIFENIRDFHIATDDEDVIGSCALHVFWEDLAELRSLAVRRDYQGKRLGMRLVNHIFSEARELGVHRVFILTAIPEYFEKAGFRPIDRSELPHKIWADCIKCPKFPDCDETAMIVDAGEQ